MDHIEESKTVKLRGLEVEVGRTPAFVAVRFVRGWTKAQKELAEKESGKGYEAYLRQVARLMMYVIRHQLDYPSLWARVRAWLMTPRRVLMAPRDEFNAAVETLIEVCTGNKKKEHETVQKMTRAFLKATENWSESDWRKLYSELPQLAGDTPIDGIGSILSANS